METVAERLVRVLKQKGKKICLAESCTGGMISSALTSVPGSSAVYDGGVCSYANSIKSNLLGVSVAALENEGAVSKTVAAQMAEGVRLLFAADIAVAVTGIAGPGGGSEAKPVGTVFIACSIDGKTAVRKFVFSGNRRVVRRKTTAEAMLLALCVLGEM